MMDRGAENMSISSILFDIAVLPQRSTTDTDIAMFLIPPQTRPFQPCLVAKLAAESFMSNVRLKNTAGSGWMIVSHPPPAIAYDEATALPRSIVNKPAYWFAITQEV
jgi:hypothetical protein